MVDPAVLEANGIDSKVYTGYASVWEWNVSPT